MTSIVFDDLGDISRRLRELERRGAFPRPEGATDTAARRVEVGLKPYGTPSSPPSWAFSASFLVRKAGWLRSGERSGLVNDPDADPADGWEGIWPIDFHGYLACAQATVYEAGTSDAVMSTVFRLDNPCLVPGGSLKIRIRLPGA
jgi:hypothetical protein